MRSGSSSRRSPLSFSTDRESSLPISVFCIFFTSFLILVLCAFVLGTLGGEVSQCHEKAILIQSGSFVPLNRSNPRFSRDLLSRSNQKTLPGLSAITSKLKASQIGRAHV